MNAEKEETWRKGWAQVAGGAGRPRNSKVRKHPGEDITQKSGGGESKSWILRGGGNPHPNTLSELPTGSVK